MNLLIEFDERGNMEDAVEGLEAGRLLGFWVAAWLGSSEWCSAVERVTIEGGRCVPSTYVSSPGAATRRMPWHVPNARGKVKLLR